MKLTVKHGEDRYTTFEDAEIIKFVDDQNRIILVLHQHTSSQSFSLHMYNDKMCILPRSKHGIYIRPYDEF